MSASAVHLSFPRWRVRGYFYKNKAFFSSAHFLRQGAAVHPQMLPRPPVRTLVTLQLWETSEVLHETGHKISRLTARLDIPKFWGERKERRPLGGDSRSLAGQGKSRKTRDEFGALRCDWQEDRSWVVANAAPLRHPHARPCLPDRCCALNERN